MNNKHYVELTLKSIRWTNAFDSVDEYLKNEEKKKDLTNIVCLFDRTASSILHNNHVLMLSNN